MLRRALSVLDAFEYRDRDVCSPSWRAAPACPSRPCLRILGSWSLGSGRAHRGGYQLGVRIFMLGEKVPRQASLRDVALPYLEDLYEATHENVNLGVLHGTDVLFLARVTGHRSSDVLLRVGDTLPAHSTSTGKVMLAHAPREVDRPGRRQRPQPAHPAHRGDARDVHKQLKTIARAGYAVNDEETHRAWSRSPPRSWTRRLALAAVSVTGRVGRLDPHRLAPAVRTDGARHLARSGRGVVEA